MKRPTRGWGAIAVLLSTAAACSDNASPTSPYPAADSAGIDGLSLGRAVAALAAIPESRSLLVARGGELLVEEYFHGVEPDALHDVRSVTKSFMSTLVGIAVDQGLIPGVDATLGDYLPGNVVDTLDPAKAGIRVRDLLTMSSGIEWAQLGGGPDFNRWAGSGDHIGFVLERPVVAPPGSRFVYSDGSVHLLSVILTEASGTSTLEFAQTHLFAPLGIGAREWAEDSRGYNAGGVGLRITPRDMVALGTLFLDEGRYQGRQLVSPEWIQAAASPQIDSRDIAFSRTYGYLWWIGADGPYPFYYANGYGGQFIVVAPSRDLVVVATTDWAGISPRAGDNWIAVITTLVTEVLPAVE